MMMTSPLQMRRLHGHTFLAAPRTGEVNECPGERGRGSTADNTPKAKKKSENRHTDHAKFATNGKHKERDFMLCSVLKGNGLFAFVLWVMVVVMHEQEGSPGGKGCGSKRDRARHALSSSCLRRDLCGDTDIIVFGGYSPLQG